MEKRRGDLDSHNKSKETNFFQRMEKRPADFCFLSLGRRNYPAKLRLKPTSL
jgi:hypothetical protein